MPWRYLIFGSILAQIGVFAGESMSGLLNGAEIAQLSIIQNARDNGYRGASYDIRIAKIVSPNGELLDSYRLPPQGIVEVISQEKVQLPLDVSGYALVKTGLCNEGLLALNIGILDPGYDGLLSSALVNFGKSERLLMAGETFLRLTFHRVTPVDGQLKPKAIADSDYIAEKQKKVVAHISEYFLNVRSLVEKVADDTMGKWRQTLLWWVPALALGLSVLTFLLNFGALWSVQRSFQPTNSLQAESFRQGIELQNELLRQQLAQSAEENKKIEARMTALEQILKSTPATNSGVAPKIP